MQKAKGKRDGEEKGKRKKGETKSGKERVKNVGEMGWGNEWMQRKRKEHKNRQDNKFGKWT